MILDKNKIITFKTFLWVCISSFFLYYSFKDFELIKFKIAIQSANINFIIIATLLLMFVIYLRALRWKMLLQNNDNVDTVVLSKGQLIGYFGNNVLPLRVGELLRTYYISQKYQRSKTKIFGSIVLERVFDLLGLIYIFLLLINSDIFIIVREHFMYGVIFLFFICIVGIVGSLFYNEKQIAALIKNRFLIIINNILEGFSSLNNKNIIPAVILTILIWTIYIFEVHLVQNAFNLNLNIYHSIFILFVSSLAMIIPGMPGNFGTFEGSIVYVFSILNVYGLSNVIDDFGFSFILHLVSFIPYTFLGLIFFINEYKIFITNNSNDKILN